MPFNLPSLPSLRNLLDPEPQVLYPPSATNTPAPSPSKKNRMRDLPPVPDDWAEERKRRGSITSQPTRPGHRRAFSAMPSSSSSSSLAQARPSTPTGISLPLPRLHTSTSTPRSTGQLPLGRLTEYSRNPLASSSALSLPTLDEDPAAQEHSTETEKYGARRVRRGSKSSVCSNISNISDLSSAPSPRRGLQSLPNPGPTSVPPPVPRGRGGRPAMSPRCWSVMDIRPSTSSSGGEDRDGTGGVEEERIGKKGLTRHSSYTRDSAPIPPSRPGLVSERRMSSSQLSDVAILASWSFPSTSDSPPEAKSNRRTASSSNSKNLSDRLRDLALIDTNPSTLGLTSQSSTPVTMYTSSTESPTRLVPRHAGAGTGMGFQPKLQHRYTHSSPNLHINNNSPNSTSIGGNGPNHRRGLRQPTPLGQPQSNLSSSPGSLLSMESDSSSGIGPISPITLSIPLPEESGGRWYDLAGKAKAWSRRGSVASSLGVGGADAQLQLDGSKDLTYRDGNEEQEEEEEEEEDYIDFDRI